MSASDLDPAGEDDEFPEYDWGTAPDDLCTRRQLRDADLSPGHEPVARLRCRRCSVHPLVECTHRAWLYSIDLAVEKRVPTLKQEEALDKAMAARQTCPECGRRFFFCLPLKRLGSCLECYDGTPLDPATYLSPSPAFAKAA